MQQEQFFGSNVTHRLERFEREEARDPNDWLAELKREVEAKHRAETEAQYKRDALTTRLMFELNRVHTVELLEEMNRALLNREGRVEPIFTDRHELCFSWPVTGGRYQIRVGADYDDESADTYLLVNGQDEQRIRVDDLELKQALIKAFREPYFNIYRW
ncbi:MAG: hypothetical protein WCS37_05185 [Chloroflexota bacterium]|nr:hypothetical protein [Chloroflexota bacterium]